MDPCFRRIKLKPVRVDGIYKVWIQVALVQRKCRRMPFRGQHLCLCLCFVYINVKYQGKKTLKEMITYRWSTSLFWSMINVSFQLTRLFSDVIYAMVSITDDMRGEWVDLKINQQFAKNIIEENRKMILLDNVWIRE